MSNIDYDKATYGEITKKIGEGNFGKVFLTDKNFVVKVTRDREEFETIQKIIESGKNGEYTPNYYEIKELSDNYFLIIMERVKPIKLTYEESTILNGFRDKALTFIKNGKDVNAIKPLLKSLKNDKLVKVLTGILDNTAGLYSIGILNADIHEDNIGYIPEKNNKIVMLDVVPEKIKSIREQVIFLIKKILSENVLNEKIAYVNDDVDFIYNKYFKDDIEYIQKYDKLPESFKKDAFPSTELSSELSKKANELNPVTILVNKHDNNLGNYYNPFEKEIAVSINISAIDYAKDFDNVSDAYDNLFGKEKISFKNEFTEHRIKGTIHHELAHWIDDTLHNNHIKQKLTKQRETGQRIKNINFTPLELEAQIHNIIQLKRKFSDKWDNLTFGEMIELSPSLTTVNRSTDYEEKKKWIFNLKKRMAREGLLGKKMFN